MPISVLLLLSYVLALINFRAHEILSRCSMDLFCPKQVQEKWRGRRERWKIFLSYHQLKIRKLVLLSSCPSFCFSQNPTGPHRVDCTLPLCIHPPCATAYGRVQTPQRTRAWDVVNFRAPPPSHPTPPIIVPPSVTFPIFFFFFTSLTLLPVPTSHPTLRFFSTLFHS